MFETKSPGLDTGAKNNFRNNSSSSQHSSQDDAKSTTEQFREFGASIGCPIFGEIKGDGKPHRVPGNDAVTYCFHPDGTPNGWFWDFRNGGKRHDWKANGRTLNHEERERAGDELKAAKRQRETEQAECHAKAAAETERRWNEAEPASPDHGYLKLKGIKPHGAREHNGELLIPAMRDGKRIGLQRIFWDATSGKWVKRFLKGAQKQGAGFIVGDAEHADTIAIAEGFATAATFYEATGIPCLVAFDAGNLLPVAQALKAAFPTGVEFIIAADDDWKREGNPGLTKAYEAAQAIGARLANPGPAFGEHRGEKDTDFNDLARLHGPEAVRGCIEAAEFVAGAADSSATEAKSEVEDAFRPVQLGNLLRNPAPSRRWLVPDWIPAGQVTLLAGDGGIGKSTLVLQLLAACATGTRWLGMDVKQGRVAVLSAEDDIDEMHWRFQCINRGLEGESEEKLEALNNAWLIDASKDLDPTLANFEEKNSALKLTDTFEKLKAFVAENAIDVLILDSAADVFSEEINRYGVRSFIRLIRGLADTVILLGHPSVSGLQSGRGYSGSTHWNNAVRSRLYFTSATAATGDEPDTDLRFLDLAKTNRSKGKQRLTLRWTENGFIRDEKAEASLDKLARQLRAEDVFMELLKLHSAQGRYLSESSASRSNYAPKIFASHPENKDRISQKEFERAMEILFGVKKIRMGMTEGGPPSKCRPCIVVGESQ